MKYNKAVLTLQTVTLLLFLIVLTACSHDRVILQGNHAVKLQQNESAPFSGWLIQDEALARILEQAEACQVKK
jgi:hypothetical protein